MINGSGHQGKLEHCGGLRFLSLVEDWHTLSVLLRPNTETVVQKIFQHKKCAKGVGSKGALSGGEKAGG